MGIVEVLDGSTDGSLELNDLFSRIGGLVVDDDFQVHPFSIHDSFDCSQVQPEIVRIEDFELCMGHH
jgi:hypothetical protein